MNKFLLFSLFLVFLHANAKAQDKHFTQFYAAPLTLNPALTGAFEGRYRVGAIYRDQWRRVLENPIRTFAVAADLRFDAPGKTNKDDAIGLGLVFFNDKVSVVDFSTTQIAISLAYHKALGRQNRQFLSLGAQLGLTQRNINYEALSFHDEFDGLTGYTGTTLEDLPTNNFAFADYNVGLNYTAQFGRSGRFFAGAALHHFLQPNISFAKAGVQGEKLYMKYSAQMAASLPLTRDNHVSLLPRVLLAVQGPHMQVNAGANVRTTLGQYGSSALHIGSWLRPARFSDGSVGLDAVVALVGFELNDVLLGLSYDLNLRALQAKQRQSAFEISVAYLGNYDNEEIICPKF
jgi:type IX secretion system PorP/SprF family membrane protein